MKRLPFLLSVIILFAAVTSTAQSKTDSAVITKNQEKIQTLTQTLKEQNDQLSSLETKLEDLKQTADKKKSDAQLSADANKTAAANLSNDTNDKKKAKRAKRAAREASNDANDARNAEKDVTHTEKSIKSLKSKIASNEKKLARLQPK